MKKFKVVLIDLDGKPVPAWVSEALEKADIEFVAHQCAGTEELLQYAGDADVVWNWGGHAVTAENLPLLKDCKAIIRTGSGTDNIPVVAATQLGIVVANTPLAHNDAVSTHAIALLFAAIRQIVPQDRAVRTGVWNPRPQWPGWHLHGQTLGLVGFGLIARLVAHKMSGFDMHILAYDPWVSAEAMAAEGVQPAMLDDLVAASDFLSLHCPLTPETHHVINERQLRRMKRSAILINTARGPVVDEPALIQALEEGWIAAAGLDVMEQEPVALDNPLLKMDNVVLSSHIGGQSDEALEACYRLSVESAIAFSQGHWPRSYVNRDVKPRLNLS